MEIASGFLWKRLLEIGFDVDLVSSVVQEMVDLGWWDPVGFSGHCKGFMRDSFQSVLDDC